MDKKPLHIVIVGHIDHGKSTLIGRLFYDTGTLSPDKFEELKRVSESLGKELEFAYIMDHLEEERKGGLTIDIAHTFFKTAKRRYVIIDAPGHKEFLKNMITGSTQAEAALLVVDISQGIEEQTKRHAYILNLLGIKQVVVLVNKMDMVDYSKDKFNDLKERIELVLDNLKISPIYSLPISAKFGENIAKRSDKLSWFRGPTVLEALDSLNIEEMEKKALRFPIQDIYELNGKALAVGRVESGTLRQNQDIFILPEGKKTKVLEIKKFMQDNLSEAQVGGCVGIYVKDAALKRGEVIVDKKTCTISDTLRSNIFWMVDEEYQLGKPFLWRCVTQESKAKIERIYQRFDAASIEVIEKDAQRIRQAEVACVEIKLDRPVIVDKFNDIPEMGRFILEYAGHPVAGGIIL